MRFFYHIILPALVLAFLAYVGRRRSEEGQ